MKKSFYLLIIVLALAAGIYQGGEFNQHENETNTEGVKSSEPVGNTFTLVDHTGQIRTDTDYKGKFLLVYFGYAFCPDVCPTALQRMAASLRSIEAVNIEAAEKIQPLFISLDPERDTQSVLAAYVAFFHPRLIGMTGTREQLKKITSQYQVYYSLPEEKDKGESYLVEHSSAMYLVGPSGNSIQHFTHDTSSAEIVKRTLDLLGGSDLSYPPD